MAQINRSEPESALGKIQWMSTKAAAEYLGITLRTLYKLIDEGNIPAYKIGRVIRVRRDDVCSFLESARIEPGSLDHLHNFPENEGENVGAVHS